VATVSERRHIITPADPRYPHPSVLYYYFYYTIYFNIIIIIECVRANNLIFLFLPRFTIYFIEGLTPSYYTAMICIQQAVSCFALSCNDGRVDVYFSSCQTYIIHKYILYYYNFPYSPVTRTPRQYASYIIHTYEAPTYILLLLLCISPYII